MLTPVSASGQICLFTAASTHLVADVTGWIPASSDFTALVPARVVDTRDGTGGVPVGRVPAGATLTQQVTGTAGIPTEGVSAVSLSVTVTGPSGPGYLTVHPCGDRPTASNVNFGAGETIANAVITPVSKGGEVCVFAAASTHVIVDVNGWFGFGDDFNALTPTRQLDTRATAPVAGGTSHTLQVAGRDGIPAEGVAAVSLNLTVTGATAAGYVTAYPCGTLPPTSTINHRAGQTIANAVLAPVSPSGTVCFYAAATTHLVVDTNGWFST